MGLPGIEIVDHGTYEGVRWWIGQQRRYDKPGTAQFNGYAELPDDHPIMTLGNSWDIANKFLDVHGTVTWAEGNIVGFDTGHLGDTAENWPLYIVRLETKAMARQIIDTNTEETRDLAKEVAYYKGLIERAIDQVEDLGFSKYELGL